MSADVITDLQAQYETGDEDEQTRALKDLTWACFFAASTCNYLGMHDLALLAAEHCRTAAACQSDRSYRGVATYAFLRVLPSNRSALWSSTLDQGIGVLQPLVGSSSVAAHAYGMHHLLAGMVKGQRGDGSAALAHLNEATQLARRYDDSSSNEFLFGPTNAAIWRLDIMAEIHEGGRALADAALVKPEALASRHRIATYYLGLCRALIQERRDADAVAALRKAESIAPQLIRMIPEARAALHKLLSRPVGARSRDLRDLAIRIG